MPTISLRLTDEELEQLRAWAHDGRRSIQKEIVWRLFTIEGAQAPKVWPADGIEKTLIELKPGEVGELAGSPFPQPALESEEKGLRRDREIPGKPADEHFKPDFGKKLG